MSAEHRKPLYAFVILFAVCGLVIGHALHTQALVRVIVATIPSGAVVAGELLTPSEVERPGRETAGPIAAADQERPGRETASPIAAADQERSGRAQPVGRATPAVIRRQRPARSAGAESAQRAAVERAAARRAEVERATTRRARTERKRTPRATPKRETAKRAPTRRAPAKRPQEREVIRTTAATVASSTRHVVSTVPTHVSPRHRGRAWGHRDRGRDHHGWGRGHRDRGHHGWDRGHRDRGHHGWDRGHRDRDRHGWRRR